MTNLDRIIDDLKAERDRLDQAIVALEGSVVQRGPGRPRGRRHMNAAARQRISEMMKKLWAERKNKTKATSKNHPRGQKVTPFRKAA